MHCRNGFKKGPLHALPHSIGCQLFRMEGFSKDLKALVTGRFTTYQKTKPKIQKKRTHYTSFPLYRPGGVRGAIEQRETSTCKFLGRCCKLCLLKWIQKGPTSCPPTFHYEARTDVFLVDYLKQISVQLAKSPKWAI